MFILENVYSATGKGKSAIARVILKPGKGERIINGEIIKDYLKSEALLLDVEQPFDFFKPVPLSTSSPRCKAEA